MGVGVKIQGAQCRSASKFETIRPSLRATLVTCEKASKETDQNCVRDRETRSATLRNSNGRNGKAWPKNAVETQRRRAKEFASKTQKRRVRFKEAIFVKPKCDGKLNRTGAGNAPLLCQRRPKHVTKARAKEPCPRLKRRANLKTFLVQSPLGVASKKGRQNSSKAHQGAAYQR